MSPQFGQNYLTNRKIACKTVSAIIIKVWVQKCHVLTVSLSPTVTSLSIHDSICLLIWEEIPVRNSQGLKSNTFCTVCFHLTDLFMLHCLSDTFPQWYISLLKHNIHSLQQLILQICKLNHQKMKKGRGEMGNNDPINSQHCKLLFFKFLRHRNGKRLW